jgi:hypothetical protein
MTTQFELDFGPISRTVDASTGKGDGINFASLAIHEATVALLASTNRNEFVAWLWHDLFKPLFWWKQNNNGYNWLHYPNTVSGDPLNFEQQWANYTSIPVGLVGTHHARQPKFKVVETETVNNEFDQIAIGKKACLLQMSFLAEPAPHTALIRAVIADAFMEVVTKEIAASIAKELATKSPSFEKVRYVFDFQQVALGNPPANSEIESLAKQYALQITNNELVIQHVIPTSQSNLTKSHTEVVIDLTSKPPTEKRFSQGVISLVELLTIYQDSRTILMGIPQFLQVDIGQIEVKVKNVAEQRLRDLDIRTQASTNELKKQSKVGGHLDWNALPLRWQGQDVDLLAHVLKEQMEIRGITPGKLTQQVKDARGNSFQIRLLSEIVSRSMALLATKTRRCRFCGSAFESDFPPGTAVVGDDFTDIEHVGFGGDICPMCRIYMLNSHQRTVSEKARGASGNRKGYRGAFAIVSPSSHFTYEEDQCKLIEKPPLDTGGRFAKPLHRATVTLQEYSLFNMLSRRIISRLWDQLEGQNASRPLPLPYLGAILLTQNDSTKIEKMFDCLELLFKRVTLRAYPFEVIVRPSVELAFEMAVNDRKQHHTKHTYLKTSPIVVSVDPDSKFTLLVDNGLQMEVSREFFEDRRRVHELLKGIKDQAQRHTWLLATLQGMDPATATVEAFYKYDAPLRQAEKAFWDAQLTAPSPAEQWQQYEVIRGEIGRIVAKYPMLIEFFAKPRRR